MATRAEKQTAYLNAIRAGVSRRLAAAAAGVDRTTAWRWLQRPAFALKVEAAEAELQGRVVTRAERGMTRSPASAVAYLARRFPEDFAEPLQRLRLEGAEFELTNDERALVESWRELQELDDDHRRERDAELLYLQVADMGRAALSDLRDHIDALLAARVLAS